MRNKLPASDTTANNVQIKCPHCGREGNKPIMKRWHFDNCKLNSTAHTPKIKSKKVTIKETESDLSRTAKFKKVAKEFKELSDLFKLSGDSKCHPDVERLINKSYSMSFLSDDEVIKAKMLFQHVPFIERPMLFRFMT